MPLLGLFISTLTNYSRQLIFAIAPIPAYLPQYWSICSSSNDPVLQKKVPKKIVENQNNISSGGGGNGVSTSGGTCNANETTVMMDGTKLELHRPASPLSEPIDVEGGFSTISILILLLSHSLRLIYFFCCGMIHTVQSYYTGNGGSAPSGEEQRVGDEKFADEVHYDLILQSISMLGIQLLLLSAITRRRRMATKHKKEDDENFPLPQLSLPSGGFSRTKSGSNFAISIPAPSSKGVFLRTVSCSNSNSNVPSSTHTSSPASGNFRKITACMKSKPSNSNTKKTTTTPTSSKQSSLSQKAFVWIYRPNKYWHGDTVRQYLELLFVMTLVIYIFCRYYAHPHNFHECVRLIKNMSILLESCLALPQMILNYKRTSTQGLSWIMVLGWIMGDCMKLIYFLISKSSKKEGLAGAEASSDMEMFILGSSFALAMDAMVGMQVMVWYPTWEVNDLKRRIRRRWIQLETETSLPTAVSNRTRRSMSLAYE